jgi:hypothetical protein
MSPKSTPERKMKDVAALAKTELGILALVLLIVETLTAIALNGLPESSKTQALYFGGAVLLLVVSGMIMVLVRREKAPPTQGIRPSPLTPDSPILNSLVNSFIETVCRAASLPETPESAKLRVFIFRCKKDWLVCSHYWAQNPVREEVGSTQFQMTPEVAQKVVVVRAAMNRTVSRTPVEKLPVGMPGVSGPVEDGLQFVLAVPVFDKAGQLWGVADFDAGNQTGANLLQTEVSNAAMFQLANHLSIMVDLPAQISAAAG